jgi:hypothetical protein
VFCVGKIWVLRYQNQSKRRTFTVQNIVNCTVSNLFQVGFAISGVKYNSKHVLMNVCPRTGECMVREQQMLSHALHRVSHKEILQLAIFD